MWQGLYDFPLLEKSTPLSTEEILESLPGSFAKKITLENESKIFKHVLTHQRIFATFYQIKINDSKAIELLNFSEDLKPYTIDKIQDLPKPTLINNFLVSDIF